MATEDPTDPTAGPVDAEGGKATPLSQAMEKQHQKKLLWLGIALSAVALVYMIYKARKDAAASSTSTTASSTLPAYGTTVTDPTAGQSYGGTVATTSSGTSTVDAASGGVLDTDLGSINSTLGQILTQLSGNTGNMTAAEQNSYVTAAATTGVSVPTGVGNNIAAGLPIPAGTTVVTSAQPGQYSNQAAAAANPGSLWEETSSGPVQVSVGQAAPAGAITNATGGAAIFTSAQAAAAA